MLAETLDRCEGHGVHRVGTDQFLDVQHIAVSGIFRACAGPQGPLDMRAPPLESRKARPAERPFELLVGQAGIGSSRFALERRALLLCAALTASFRLVLEQLVADHIYAA